MKFHTCIFLSLILFIISCEQKTPYPVSEANADHITEVGDEEPSIIKVVFDSASISCEGNCADIKIETIFFAPQNSMSAVNRKWSSVMTSQQAADLESFRKAMLDTIQSFNSDFSYFRKEYPKAAGYYEWFEKDSLFYAGEDHITIQQDVYQYWGGAHGMNWLNYYNISKDGKLMDYTDFVMDTMLIKTVAEKAFRKQYGIAPDAHINSTGKMFPETGFFLPKNFAFTADSVIFVYQPYDVDAYAFGRHRFAIPISDIH